MRHQTQRNEDSARQGRLQARLAQITKPETTGIQPLALDTRRDALLYVPDTYQSDRPAPFAVMLHGAGGDAERTLTSFQPFADTASLIVLVPSSRRHTWDVITGGFGPDIALIDRALALTFARYAIDPAHVAIGGFSDGASYALSVGITNGDLFTHVLAFSPGFAAPADQIGQPRIYISHGTHDAVLPIDRCSRRLVPMLTDAGYDVTYHEFDGPHTVPPAIAQAAVGWFVA